MLILKKKINLILPQPEFDLQQIGHDLRTAHQLPIPGPLHFLGQEGQKVLPIKKTEQRILLFFQHTL